MYVVGVDPTIASIERFIARRWSMVKKPKIYYLNEGYFVVRFGSLDNRNKALYVGPQLMNIPIIIKTWTPEFDFAKEALKTIPLGKNSLTYLSIVGLWTP